MASAFSRGTEQGCRCCLRCDVGGGLHAVQAIANLPCRGIFGGDSGRNDHAWHIGVALDGWKLTGGDEGVGLRARRALAVWVFGKSWVLFLGVAWSSEYLGPGSSSPMPED